MPLTDSSDIFIGVYEDGINRVLRHVGRQRPSLLNYATEWIAERPGLWCRPIDAHPVVIARGNPLFTVIPAVPVLGTPVSVDVSAQVGDLLVDLHPTDELTPPPELSLPLAPNTLMARGSITGGLGCPGERGRDGHELPRKGVVHPGQMDCFRIDAYAVAKADFVGAVGDRRVQAQLIALELVDLTPTGLENAIECYVTLAVRLGILPQLGLVPIELVEDVMGLATLTIEPTTGLPANPAIDQDVVRVFLDATVGDSSGGSGGGGGGGGDHDTSGGVVKARARTGPFDLVAAVNEATVKHLVGKVVDSFQIDLSDSGSFGPFTASYAVQAHLEGGDVDLRSDGSILISELDVKWDELEVCLGLDIPEICIGGFCIIPSPWGCLLRAPEICVFSDSPDIEFCLDLGGLITSEISLAARPLTKYRVDPGRTPSMTSWDARDAGIPNRWQLFIDPIWLDFDLIDIADTVGDLLDAAIDAAVDDLLGWLPGWAKDLIKAILGPIVDLIRTLLDIGDDIDEWLSDLLGVSFGLFDLILQLVADALAGDSPVFELDDPTAAMPEDAEHIAVLIPVEYLGVRVEDTELIVEADIGDTV